MTTINRKIVLLFLGISSLPTNSFAYIDPGAGSYITQIVIAVFVVALFKIKYILRLIKGFLKRVFSKRAKRYDKSRR